MLSEPTMLVRPGAAAGSARGATAITAVDSSGYLVFMIASLVAPDNFCVCKVRLNWRAGGTPNRSSGPHPRNFRRGTWDVSGGGGGRYPGSGTPARAVRLP